MVDPFAAALDVLFAAPGSEAAVYTPPGGAPVALRVIRDSATERVALGESQVDLDTEAVQIRAADVAQPVTGATLAIGDEVFTLQGGRMRSSDRLTWTCGMVPA